MELDYTITALIILSLCSAGLIRATSIEDIPPNILLFFPDELRYDWGGLANNPWVEIGLLMLLSRGLQGVCIANNLINLRFLLLLQCSCQRAWDPHIVKHLCRSYYNNLELPLITPHLDELALNGVRFTRAFVGAPVCAPSRACLASGRQYDENTVPQNFHNDFDANVTTFYKVGDCSQLDDCVVELHPARIHSPLWIPSIQQMHTIDSNVYRSAMCQVCCVVLRWIDIAGRSWLPHDGDRSGWSRQKLRRAWRWRLVSCFHTGSANLRFILVTNTFFLHIHSFNTLSGKCLCIRLSYIK